MAVLRVSIHGKIYSGKRMQKLARSLKIKSLIFSGHYFKYAERCLEDDQLGSQTCLPVRMVRFWRILYDFWSALRFYDVHIIFTRTNELKIRNFRSLKPSK